MLGQVWDGLTKPNDVRRPMSSFIIWLGCHVAAGDVAPALAVTSIHEQLCFLVNSHLDPWAVAFSCGRLFSYKGGRLCL